MKSTGCVPNRATRSPGHGCSCLVLPRQGPVRCKRCRGTIHQLSAGDIGIRSEADQPESTGLHNSMEISSCGPHSDVTLSQKPWSFLGLPHLPRQERNKTFLVGLEQHAFRVEGQLFKARMLTSRDGCHGPCRLCLLRHPGLCCDY